MLRFVMKRILLVPRTVCGHVKDSNGTQAVEKLWSFGERELKNFQLLRGCLGIVAESGNFEREKRKERDGVAISEIVHGRPEGTPLQNRGELTGEGGALRVAGFVGLRIRRGRCVDASFSSRQSERWRGDGADLRRDFVFGADARECTGRRREEIVDAGGFAEFAGDFGFAVFAGWEAAGVCGAGAGEGGEPEAAHLDS